MRDVSQILRWVYVAVVFAYLAVQVLALLRLRGDQKRRSGAVLTVMLVLMFGSDAIRDIFILRRSQGTPDRDGHNRGWSDCSNFGFGQAVRQ